MRTDLERFFNPRAIAIVGASQELTTISGQPLKHLTSHGYKGKLYPVNPRYPEVAGFKCYAALADLPETPDLVLVLVNASRVADVLRQCGAKGVPYVIIFSSGFSEVGGGGVDLQRQLAAIAREFDIGVIGPNCQGMINVADSVFAGFGSVFHTDYEPGVVSMVSQSGGFGFSVMNLSSKDGGLKFRQMVTTGNEIGVSHARLHRLFHPRSADRDHRRLSRGREGCAPPAGDRRPRARRRQADHDLESRQHRAGAEGRGLAHRQPRRRDGALPGGVPPEGHPPGRGHPGPGRLRPRVPLRQVAARATASRS